MKQKFTHPPMLKEMLTLGNSEVFFVTLRALHCDRNCTLSHMVCIDLRPIQSAVHAFLCVVDGKMKGCLVDLGEHDPTVGLGALNCVRMASWCHVSNNLHCSLLSVSLTVIKFT